MESDLTMTLSYPSPSIVHIMCPFLVSLEEILTNEGSGAHWAYITGKWTGSSMAQLMSLAFILPKESCWANIRKPSKLRKLASGSICILTNEYKQTDVDPDGLQHGSRYGRASD